MTMIRCLAIDDEPLALKQVVSYISKIPYLDLVGSCRSAAEAAAILDKESVDAMFVDINISLTSEFLSAFPRIA